MEKSKIFLDLSKLSREELMTLPQILKKAGETLLYPIDFNDVKYWSTLHKPNYANYWTLGTPRSTPEKNELTYPEFIKLFEGGETIKSDNTQTLHNDLEQIEKLKADKKELVSFLEDLSYNVFWKGRTLDSRDKYKIKSLIQKHKR